jgi:hypothetical protein
MEESNHGHLETNIIPSEKYMSHNTEMVILIG